MRIVGINIYIFLGIKTFVYGVTSPSITGWGLVGIGGFYTFQETFFSFLWEYNTVGSLGRRCGMVFPIIKASVFWLDWRTAQLSSLMAFFGGFFLC